MSSSPRTARNEWTTPEAAYCLGPAPTHPPVFVQQVLHPALVRQELDRRAVAAVRRLQFTPVGLDPVDQGLTELRSGVLPTSSSLRPSFDNHLGLREEFNRMVARAMEIAKETVPHPLKGNEDIELGYATPTLIDSHVSSLSLVTESTCRLPRPLVNKQASHIAVPPTIDEANSARFQVLDDPRNPNTGPKTSVVAMMFSGAMWSRTVAPMKNPLS